MALGLGVILIGASPCSGEAAQYPELLDGYRQLADWPQPGGAVALGYRNWLARTGLLDEALDALLKVLPRQAGPSVGFRDPHPAFSSVEFVDAGRSTVHVPVTIGYSGATVVLNKVNGVWTMTALINEWIT